MSKKQPAEFDPNGVGLDNGHFIGLPFTEETAKVVLLSIPWDLTVSYADGTATGPENILQASTQLDLYDADIPDAWKTGIYLKPSPGKWLKLNRQLRNKSISYIRFLEEGGKLENAPDMQLTLNELNDACDTLRLWVRKKTNLLLDAGKKVGVVGGEHSVPLGFLETLAEREGPFGILQIDAHMDLRKAYEGFTYSHASIFRNALEIPQIEKLVQVGIRDACEEEWKFVEASEGRVVVFPDQELQEITFEGQTWESICDEILVHLPQKVYISFDIDGLDPKLCPNTGTPVPGGLDLPQAFYLLKKLMLSGRQLIGFDLSEVAGSGNEWDGNVGARILYKLANWLGQ
ncbi:MAG: agmatinase family protein [Saprospiraceae bacterium]|nr:agmatinase family protein [Saprospiraceae bacterium]